MRKALLMDDRGKTVEYWEPRPGVYIPVMGDGPVEHARLQREMDRLFPAG